MSQIDLESKFERINLEEGPCKPKESIAAKCDCKKLIIKSLDQWNTGSSLKLKVKERRKNLIKPARLKLIGTCWSRKSRTGFQEETSKILPIQPPSSIDLESFASQAFLKMRISQSDVLTHPPASPSEEKDERTSPVSQPNSCSAQAKLQQQFSTSSEFDSTIDEMSEFLAYHLNLYPQDKNYLVNSMYT